MSAPRPSRRRLLALGASAPLLGAMGALGTLAGCTLNDAPRRDFHVLRDAGAGAAPPAKPAVIERALLVDVAASPTLYDSDHMVFSADGSSRSYFQFAQWSERPARSLLRLAEERLSAAGKFSTVALSSSGVRGDLLLTLRLDELYLDDARRPGRVHLAFTATLLDWRQRRLIARRSFSGTQDAATQDAAGLARSAGVVLGALLGELVDWAGASAAAG